MIDLLILRTIFVAVLACAAYFLRPLNLDGPVAAVAGGLVGASVVLFEFRIRRISLKKLIGAGAGEIPSYCRVVCLAKYFACIISCGMLYGVD